MIIDVGEPTCAICRDYFAGKFDAPSHIWESASSLEQKIERTWKECCEKGHIVPHALAGSDTDPSNFVPICNMCNKQDPHTTNIDEWFEWVELANGARKSDAGLISYMQWMEKK